MKETGVEAVPYGAQPYMGKDTDQRKMFDGATIELPNWDEDYEELKGDDVIMKEAGKLSKGRYNFEEAADFLRLPY